MLIHEQAFKLILGYSSVTGKVALCMGAVLRKRYFRVKPFLRRWSSVFGLQGSSPAVTAREGVHPSGGGHQRSESRQGVLTPQRRWMSFSLDGDSAKLSFAGGGC